MKKPPETDRRQSARTTSNLKEKEERRSIVSTRVMNSSLTNISARDVDNHRKEKNRSEVAIERSNTMYINALKKLENRKKEAKKIQELNISKELENCTFKPKILPNNKFSRNKKVEQPLNTKES